MVASEPQNPIWTSFDRTAAVTLSAPVTKKGDSFYFFKYTFIGGDYDRNIFRWKYRIVIYFKGFY